MIWPPVPLRRLARVVNGGTPLKEPSYWDGDIPWATPIDLGRAHGAVLTSTDRRLTDAGVAAGSAAVPAGSVLVSTRAPIGYVARTDQAVAFNQGCRALLPGPNIDPRFLTSAIMASQHELEGRALGTTFAELSSDGLGSVPIPVPPLEEQRRIADFLEAQGVVARQLDQLRERQRDLLKEEFEAMLDDRLVSPYLTARVPLMFLTDPTRPIQYGIILPGPDFPGGVPIIKGGDVGRGRLDVEMLSRTDPEIDARYSRSRVRGGDYVVAIRGSVGEIGEVPESLTNANLTQDSARIAPHRCESTWLGAVVQTRFVQGEIARRVTGATIKGINIADLRRISVPFPPREEQHRLGVWAQGLIRRRRAASVALHRAQQLTAERQQALITAAVTGEIDVTTARGVA